MGDDGRARSASAAWRASVVSRARGATAASQMPPSVCSSATPSSSHASERTELDGTTRSVRFSDQELLAMAADAASAIPWDALKKPPSTRWSRKKLSSASASCSPGTLSIYTREDPQSFAVLASALLQCSVQELRLVFDTRTSEQLSDVVRTLSPRDVLAAELVHSVRRSTSSRASRSRHSSHVGSVVSTASASSTSVSSSARRRHASADVVVTAMTFDKANVFARTEEWCFLEALEDATAGSDSSSPRAFTKTLLALHPVDCVFQRVAPRAKHGRDVLAGFRFEEETDGRSTRVLFSGELFYSSNSSSSKARASHRTVRARLLQVAQWIDRIALVVRRRRLGIQVLADRRSVLRATASHCVCCRRSFVLARKKSCGVCGQSVCERCSASEARETCPSVLARSVVTHVRVCDTCMVRVNQCRYAMVTPEDLAPARVVADASVAQRTPTTPAATTGAVLSHLLQETMANASEARKQSARSVIKYLVEQETTSDRRRRRSRSCAAPQCVSLTDASTDAQYFAALQAHLNTEALPLDQCVLGNVDKRTYPLTFPDDPARAVAYPIGPTEPLRLKLLDDEQYLPVLTRDTSSPATPTQAPTSETSTTANSATPPELLLPLDKVPELDIICAIASKELACSGSLITLVGKDAMHVVASTIDAFASKSFPRDQGFCSQTIMSDKPLLVPHPESDVRFANIAPVAQLGVRFYCGFPLVAADATTVIGSVCCVDHESRELTQSQYTVMQKLATTASRVVQAKAKARRLQSAAERRE